MSKWTEFQKSCVQHIAGLLHSIRGLVETLGSDALERYCRYGRLGNNCLERLKSANFTKPETYEETEDEPSGDEGSEDEEPGNQGSGYDESAHEEPGEGEIE